MHHFYHGAVRAKSTSLQIDSLHYNDIFLDAKMAAMQARGYRVNRMVFYVANGVFIA
jgi:hypothetical protein